MLWCQQWILKMNVDMISIYKSKVLLNFPLVIIFAVGVYDRSLPYRDESISRKISIVLKIATSEAKWFERRGKREMERTQCCLFLGIARGKFVEVQGGMERVNGGS